MRRVFIFIFILIFINSQISPLYAGSLAADFLCELGINYFSQQKYQDALMEFKKALIIQADHPVALEYIKKIQETITVSPKEPSLREKERKIEEELEEIERKMLPPEVFPSLEVFPTEIKAPAKKEMPISVIKLDASLESLTQPFEIEQGRSLIIQGNNIQRFLVTEPEKLEVERKGSDELILTAKEIGSTYIHIWDTQGRWTIQTQTIFPKPKEPTLEEILREKEEQAKSFKLRYNLDWTSYETGRRIKSLNRQYYSWRHGLSLTGPTPYGDLDSSAVIGRTKTTTDLTYFTLGLSNGEFTSFKGFSLRGFDYSPGFSNLIFPGASLRGVVLSSPAFKNKINYTAFWGREGGGRYGDLSPGLGKQKHSFLEGFNLGFSGFKDQFYRFSWVKGWGRQRADYLNDMGYDLEGTWNFKNLNLSYEIAHDTETFAHLVKSRFSLPKLTLTTEFRNIDKDFLNILGTGWHQGEIGGYLGLNYAFSDRLFMDISLDAYLDRLYPAEDNPDRLNEYLSWYLSYQLGPYSSLSLSYSLNNMLGKSSPYRYQNFGLTLSHTFKGWRDIYTYLSYTHQESKNFYSHSSDYINERIYSGLRFNLIGDLYYYLNKEINFVEARSYTDHSHPHALETGIGWSGRILESSFYGNFRIGYRDEEETVAPLAFLSGQDYLEGYLELSYRASEDKEIYASSRFRNNWQDAPSSSKGVEFDFNAGMRYLWDTKIKWKSVGHIEGYVFKDFNCDGIKQKDEPAVEGIKIYLGKDKFQITDKDGYFRFKSIRAEKVYLTLDTSSLPLGYVLTTPVTQEVNILHLGTQRVYFGMTSRLEIIGFVFEDKDGNGQFSAGDLGVTGVVISLEDGKKVVTDNSGRYSFSLVSPGEHTLTLEINTLPVHYLPLVPLKIQIVIQEGESLYQNFPLRKISE